MKAHMDDRSLDTYLFNREDRPLDEPTIDERSVDESRSEPRGPGREVTFHARDGHRLAASLFEPVGTERRGAVVVASATGVRRGYYGRFAADLAADGFAVLTFDYRGIGDSREGPMAESTAAMHEWGEQDLDAAISYALQAFATPSVAVVGHSVGGQLLGMVPNPDRIARVVTVGSQSGEVWLWPSPSKWRMALVMYGLIPGVTHAVGYLPGVLGIGEDLPKGVALEWARWCRTPGYLLSEGGPPRREAYAQLKAPILAFGFDDDPYAPPEAVSALLGFYENAPSTRRQVSRAEARVGHFGFFRSKFRGTFWREVSAFLAASS
jgi:predicted alpha/beta hydrolase